MILKAIYNYFFLLHSIVVCYFCSASRLIVCQIPSAVLSFRRGVVFIVVHDTKIRFVYHFLISLHIGSSACVLHIFREVCIFIMLKHTALASAYPNPFCTSVKISPIKFSTTTIASFVALHGVDSLGTSAAHLQKKNLLKLIRLI